MHELEDHMHAKPFRVTVHWRFSDHPAAQIMRDRKCFPTLDRAEFELKRVAQWATDHNYILIAAYIGERA